MSLVNTLGDVEVHDPQRMRALAHPVRLAAMRHLQRSGPATATQLAAVVGASPSVTSWHLRHLADFGLICEWDGGTDRRQRWWQAIAAGFRVSAADTDEGRAAYAALTTELLAGVVTEAEDWLTNTAPRLDDRWIASTATSSTGLLVTVEELAGLADRIDELLAPYTSNRPDPPTGAQPARALRLLLPQPLQ